jgi:hypothetical protein
MAAPMPRPAPVTTAICPAMAGLGAFFMAMAPSVQMVVLLGYAEQTMATIRLCRFAHRST